MGVMETGQENEDVIGHRGFSALDVGRLQLV